MPEEPQTQNNKSLEDELLSEVVDGQESQNIHDKIHERVAEEGPSEEEKKHIASRDMTTQQLAHKYIGQYNNPGKSAYRAEEWPIQLVMDSVIHLTAELGRARLSVSKVANLTVGSIVELPGSEQPGQLIHILANGRIVGYGNIVTIGGDEIAIKVVKTVSINEKQRFSIDAPSESPPHQEKRAAIQ